MENNIHILPTDKPSRLYSYKSNLFLTTESHLNVPSMEYQNIYITSDEEIKEGDCYLDTTVNVLFKNDRLFLNGTGYKKIILTTDQDLIKYGVQAIDDEFLEWFVKNPSCEFVEVKHKEVIQYGNMTMHDHNGDGSYYFCTNCEVETSRSKEELLKFGVEYYKIIIPKEEPKQENCCTPIGQIKRYVDCVGCDRKPRQETTLEDFCIKFVEKHFEDERTFNKSSVITAMKVSAKWQQQNSYSEEEIKIWIDRWSKLKQTPQRDMVIKIWSKLLKKK